MRQIKFRGKETSKPNRWVTGNYYEENGASFIWIKGEMKNWPIEVDAETVGQFTGLLDKNGKEIYEGDILLKEGTHMPIAVSFNHGAFGFTNIFKEHYAFAANPNFTFYPKNTDGTFEIIGNITDTPELKDKFYD